MAISLFVIGVSVKTAPLAEEIKFRSNDSPN